LTPGASTVRVMTWNIHGGMGPDGRHDLDRMLTLVRRADPDVLALQEIDSRRAPGSEHPIAMLKRVLGHHGISAAAITTPAGTTARLCSAVGP
jgi:endonuclease/exonuclease/phosphatase family metal-dependent hydrolase